MKDHKRLGETKVKYFNLPLPEPIGKAKQATKTKKAKRCPTCERWTQNYYGTDSRCKDCESKRDKERNRERKIKTDAYRLNRMARKYDLAAALTENDLIYLKKYFGGVCAVCGSGNVQYDHWTPLSRFGGSVPDNIILLCEQCNRDKFDLLPDKWLTQKEVRSGQLRLWESVEHFDAVRVLNRITEYFKHVTALNRESD